MPHKSGKKQTGTRRVTIQTGPRKKRRPTGTSVRAAPRGQPGSERQISVSPQRGGTGINTVQAILSRGGGTLVNPKSPSLAEAEIATQLQRAQQGLLPRTRAGLDEDTFNRRTTFAREAKETERAARVKEDILAGRDPGEITPQDLANLSPEERTRFENQQGQRAEGDISSAQRFGQNVFGRTGSPVGTAGQILQDRAIAGAVAVTAGVVAGGVAASLVVSAANIAASRAVTVATAGKILSRNPAVRRKIQREIAKQVTAIGILKPLLFAGGTILALGSYVGALAWGLHLDLDNVVGGLDITIRDTAVAAEFERDPTQKAKLLAENENLRNRKRELIETGLSLEWTDIIPYKRVIQAGIRGLTQAGDVLGGQDAIAEGIKLDLGTAKEQEDAKLLSDIDLERSGEEPQGFAQRGG